MIFPTTSDLTKGKYNRYEVALATAKCARMITNEYVRQRAVRRMRSWTVTGTRTMPCWMMTRHRKTGKPQRRTAAMRRML